MLQFQLMTEKDRREAAAIELRRAREEERKKRIFNPKTRLIGNDIKALEQQIEEKKKLEAERRKIDQIFGEQLVRNDQISVAMGKKEIENFCVVRMLQFQLMTEKDRREAAAIELRRAREEERKKRIFNPKTRLIGNDIKALEQQIEEKKKLEAERRKIDQIFGEQLVRNDQISVAMGKKEIEERKKMALEVENFRVNFQRVQDRREFDLNDPDYLKKSLPARIHDNDPRISLSSMQKFEGEDVAAEERKQIQKEQIQSWLQQQVEERESAENEQRAAENAYKEAIDARDQRALELERLEKDCRKRLEKACCMFNRSLADERYCQEKEKKRQEQEDNMAQMYNTLTSDMMTENPDVSMSNMGSNRRIGYLYKGMSKDELDKFRKAQLAQLEEVQKKRAEEIRFQREWDDYSNGIQKTIALMDKELAKKEKERRVSLAEENKRMAVEQKNNQDYMNKIVYRNKPSASFYDQFNRSTR
ncbi:hypothetical protein FQA39_LY04438 [Lamprigera yunnana]|nr:hypothetical protein FQA39_LY04438 [Lamprigera yunnana]